MVFEQIFKLGEIEIHVYDMGVCDGTFKTVSESFQQLRLATASDACDDFDVWSAYYINQYVEVAITPNKLHNTHSLNPDISQ
jgi:hypothetical protein